MPKNCKHCELAVNVLGCLCTHTQAKTTYQAALPRQLIQYKLTYFGPITAAMLKLHYHIALKLLSHFVRCQ